MNAFIVDLANRPGELAKLTAAIALKGIDIVGCCGVARGDAGAVVLLTNDEAATRGVLDRDRYTVRETELVPVWLSNKPGSLAEATRRLADAAVNIEAMIPIGIVGANVKIAFATDNPGKTRVALGDGILEATAR